MAKVPQCAWAALWIANGGNPRKADTYSAIVMAESGGDSNAQNSIKATGGPQILLSAHPDVSEACAKNPACSTKKSIEISNNGRDWSPWVTYTSGAYESFVGGSGFGRGKPTPNKRKAKAMLVDFKIPFAPDVPLPGPDFGFGGGGDIIGKGAGAVAEAGIPGISEIAGAVQGVNAFFTGLGELILTPEGWLRVAKLGGGSILIFWGLRVIVRESTGTDPVKAASSTVKKGAELAALAATVK